MRPYAETLPAPQGFLVGRLARRLGGLLRRVPEVRYDWVMHFPGEPMPEGLSPGARIRVLVADGNDYAGTYFVGRAGDADWARAYAWVPLPAEVQHD